MQLKTKEVKFSTGGPLVAVINEKDATKLDLNALDRIKIKYNSVNTVNVILDITKDNTKVRPGYLGLFEETAKIIDSKKHKIVSIYPSENPFSVEAIRKKLDGKELSKKEIEFIVKDLVSNGLSDIEIAYFVAGCYKKGLTYKETVYLTKAIANEGKTIKLKNKIVADKHCVGGIPNNRTTMIVTPIIASAGLTMIKTSSRSITSPSGTSDTMEVLAKVDFTVDEIKNILKKTNGCMVWAGAMELASADSKLIKVRHPLRLDPSGLMIASILAKKAAVGSTHLLIDIPVGHGAKITNKKDGKKLKKKFEKIARALGIKTRVIFTNGSQPIGNGIGPALEARDVLYILRREPGAPKDLEEKAIMMADRLFRLTNTKASAREILESGQAYKKMKEIIKAQQGNPNILPEQIVIGKLKYDYKSKKTGSIEHIDNLRIAKIARLAGAPSNKGAGLYIYKKVSEQVKRGEKLFTIYSENREKLELAKGAIDSAIIVK
nr:hypothetical protein [Nanoarchaeum sp.]